MSRRIAYTRRRESLRLKKRLIGAAVLAAVSCVVLIQVVLEPEQALAARSNVAGSTVPGGRGQE